MTEAVAAESRRPLLLVSPTDRHCDAARLRRAGHRVITTSQVQSTMQQMLDAAPCAIWVELVPSLAEETLEFVSQLAMRARFRHIPVMVYGTAATALQMEEVAAMGVARVHPTDLDREELVIAVQ